MIDIKELKTKFLDLKIKLNFDQKKIDLLDLQRKSEDPHLWDDQNNAQVTLQNISDLQKIITLIENIDQEISSIEEFQTILQNNSDPSLDMELDNNFENLKKKVDELELQTYLSGKYDLKFALLSIHSGKVALKLWIGLLCCNVCI